ncbi:MAG TPA: hypothetical protein PK765_06325 [bacterium]|nr:hypothetical protein [bacterium]
MQPSLTPYNAATRAVIETLSGIRTPERTICEFYGLSVGDLTNAETLRTKEIFWHPRLATLGVDEMVFSAITGIATPEPTSKKRMPIVRRKGEKGSS